MGELTSEIFQEGERWHWSVNLADGSPRATSQVLGGYETKQEAEAEGAVAAQRASYEIVEHEDGGGWRWRQIDADGAEVESSGVFEDQHAAAAAVEARIL